MIFDCHLTKEEEKEKNLGWVGRPVRLGWGVGLGLIECVEMDLGHLPVSARPFGPRRHAVPELLLFL